MPSTQPPPPPPATTECACGVCTGGEECCPRVTYRCFPAAARISFENGKLVKIFELQTGDRVQIGGHWGNTLK